MLDQTWQYHFCAAWHQARADIHVGKDRRLSRNRSKSDRASFQIEAFAAGYEIGWLAEEGGERPYLSFLRWAIKRGLDRDGKVAAELEMALQRRYEPREESIKRAAGELLNLVNEKMSRPPKRKKGGGDEHGDASERESSQL